MDIKNFFAFIALIILRIVFLSVTIIIGLLGLIICLPSRECRRELFSKGGKNGYKV